LYVTNLANVATLEVRANANIIGNILVSSNANISGNLHVVGNIANVANLVVRSNANISGNLYVVGNVANVANLAVRSNAAIDGNLFVLGNIANVANLEVRANATIAGTLTVTGVSTVTANVNTSGYFINNLGYPTQDDDAASKSYVDTLVSSGISYHIAVQAATTGPLASTVAAGSTITYADGPDPLNPGVFATITITGSATFNTIDGVDMTLSVTGNPNNEKSRVLVKNEAQSQWNGVYYRLDSKTLVRSIDADEYGQDTSEQLSINDYFFVIGGTVNGGSAYVVNSPSGEIIFNTTPITFATFTTSRSYTASTGLTLSGTAFSITDTAVTIGTYGTAEKVGQFTVNKQGQITGAASVDITAPAGALTGTTLKSTVVTSSLTSVGTLTILDVAGNITTTGNVVGKIGALGNNISTTTGNFVTGSGNFEAGSGKFVGNGAFITDVARIKTGLNEVIADQTGNVQVNINGTSGILVVKDVGATGADQGNVVLVNTGNLAVASGFFYKGDGSLLTGVKAELIANGKSNVIAYLDSNINISPNGVANSVVFANTTQTVGNVIFANGNIVINKLDGTAATGHIYANGTFLTGILANSFSNGISNAQLYSNANLQLGLGGFANTVIFANKSQTAGNVILANGNIVLANLDGNFFFGNGNTLTGMVRLAANASNLIIYGANGNIGVSVNNVANTVLFANSADGSGNVMITKGNIYIGNVSGATGALQYGYIFGNGAFLTGVATSTIPNTVANTSGGLKGSNIIVRLDGNIEFSTGGTSNTVVFANKAIAGGSQANSINTRGSIAVDGDNGASADGYIHANGYFLKGVANMMNGTSNISIRKDGNIVVGAVGVANVLNINGTTVTANANLVFTSGGGANISNVNFITANYFFGDGSFLGNVTRGNAIINGNSKVVIPTANSDISFDVGGHTNVVRIANLTSGSGNVIISNGNILINNSTGVVGAGYIFANGAYLTGVGTSSSGNLSVTGNVVATTFYGNLIGGNINLGSNLFVTTGNANIGNVYITGNVNSANISVNGNVFSNGAVIGNSLVSAEVGTELSVIARNQPTFFPVTGLSAAAGTDVHVTGADGSITRITQDAFGTGTYVAFTGRTARGTAGGTTGTIGGDILTQFTARGYVSGTLQFGTVSTGRLDFTAAQDFNDTSRGTNAAIYTTANGSITPTATALFDNNGNLRITGNIIGNVNGANIGYRDVPQLALSGATTLPIDAAGKHYYYTSSGNTTITIPASGTTNFPIGTAVTLVNLGLGNIVVNRATTGVLLYLSGNGTVSNRAVANVGMATLLKVNTDTWFINGANVVFAT
jgi:hypothetical protein